MSRRHLTFTSESSNLVGTLDQGNAPTGLLIVTGGNEVRSGAFASQAQIAAQVAEQGFPAFRFDRRGTGDSEGPNGEFTSSGPDIAAALAAFRTECPQLTRIVAFGNCDAASALMLISGAGTQGLILSNPWTFEDGEEEEPSPDAVRDHYRRRLADPAAIKRLLTGKVSLGSLVSSLKNALRPAPPASGLVQDMAAGIERYQGAIVFLVAERDRTGQAFLSSWNKADPRIRRCPDATHAYVEPAAREWLLAQVLEQLREN